MTTSILPKLVSAFFTTHLGAERNVSARTVMAYRDAMKLLLRFVAEQKQCQVARLDIHDLSPDAIINFLSHLETVRQNSVRTRNARLAAIHSFFHYVLSREPDLAVHCQRVLAIPFRKATRRILGYLSEAELKHLLAQVDRTTPYGERDYVLLALLYDTGGRIEEILGARPADFRAQCPAFLRVLGKGRKERLCPLLPQTARVLERFLKEQGRDLGDGMSILQNRRGERLTQHGARYLMKKYLSKARVTMPSLGRAGISPHTLRHSKGMHLLQSGVPLITIKDVLGHADLKSTEIYVQADLEMKRKALQSAGTPTRIPRRKPQAKEDLLAWLESL
jgi:site-specific recombinase XerD